MSLVLADTSIWVEHFRHANPVLESLVAMELASVLLTPGALLWTADKCLLAQAGRLGVAFVAVRQ